MTRKVLNGADLGGALNLYGIGGNSFLNGTGDGATYATYNFVLRVWNGWALTTYDGSVSAIFDGRGRQWDTINGYRVNGTTVIDGSRNVVANNGTFNGSTTFKAAVLEPGLQIVAAVAAGSTTIAQTTSTLVLNPSATIASYTVTFPTPLGDGHLFEVLTTNTITTLTCTGSSGSTVKNAPTTLSAGTGFEYIYSAASTTWFRKR